MGQPPAQISCCGCAFLVPWSASRAQLRVGGDILTDLHVVSVTGSGSPLSQALLGVGGDIFDRMGRCFGTTVRVAINVSGSARTTARLGSPSQVQPCQQNQGQRRHFGRLRGNGTAGSDAGEKFGVRGDILTEKLWSVRQCDHGVRFSDKNRTIWIPVTASAVPPSM